MQISHTPHIVLSNTIYTNCDKKLEEIAEDKNGIFLNITGETVAAVILNNEMAPSIKLRLPSTYEAMNKSGLLRLPSLRTLPDYTHVIKLDFQMK